MLEGRFVSHFLLKDYVIHMLPLFLPLRFKFQIWLHKNKFLARLNRVLKKPRMKGWNICFYSSINMLVVFLCSPCRFVPFLLKVYLQRGNLVPLTDAKAIILMIKFWIFRKFLDTLTMLIDSRWDWLSYFQSNLEFRCH